MQYIYMKEPFSPGYLPPHFIADQIQKRSHNACCKKYFICPVQPDGAIYGHGTKCSHKAVEQSGQGISFPEHFEYCISHGVIGLHRQRVHALYRILYCHFFPGVKS